MNNRLTSSLVIFLVWAAIYIPALGSHEIKGEEGRRILPAVRMLETGDYIVPRVGSDPYLRKPPLINWLVAASFKIFGQCNEWTARLPSVLCVLAVALVFITVGCASLGQRGSTIAALIWLTNFGIIEKGRLIEIEALYASLFAIAFICWLTWWEKERPIEHFVGGTGSVPSTSRRHPFDRLRTSSDRLSIAVSPWLTWTVPWIFLGLGWLAKGPLHVFFFYATVVAVLWDARELKAICTLPHLIGLIIMMSIFAAWAIPFAQMTGGAHTAHVWSRQFSGRLAPEDFHFAAWTMNIPRSLAYFLPWLVFAPLALDRDRRSRLQSALIWAIAIPLVVVDLIPGSLPRYTMPLIAPFAWLLGSTLSAESAVWPRWLGGKSFSLKARQRTIAAIAAATCAALCLYAIAIVPRLQARQKSKPIAAQIEAAIPESERLYAVDPDYQPFLFYVRRPIVYVSNVEELPFDTRYFLVQLDNEKAAETAQQWLPAVPHRVLSIQDYRGKRISLFTVGSF